ncbi:hypothetical protein HanIR_Chr04g0173651 [Helianthus annuus]|nr:hypothetical protein HanIR_Chr04g0173651 [Helianthus annuus]
MYKSYPITPQSSTHYAHNSLHSITSDGIGRGGVPHAITRYGDSITDHPVWP